MIDNVLFRSSMTKLSDRLTSFDKNKIGLNKKMNQESYLNFPDGSASVLVIRDGDKILAISRKGDHDDLGLPGGKIEQGESPITAACREAVEEIGKPVCNPRLIHLAKVGKISVFVFSADLVGQLSEHINSEDSKVCWVLPKEICSGTFGKFNRKHILPLL